MVSGERHQNEDIWRQIDIVLSHGANAASIEESGTSAVSDRMAIDPLWSVSASKIVQLKCDARRNLDVSTGMRPESTDSSMRSSARYPRVVHVCCMALHVR